MEIHIRSMQTYPKSQYPVIRKRILEKSMKDVKMMEHFLMIEKTGDTVK